MGEEVVRRLFPADRRGGDRYLRVTWHRDTSTLVLSHWDSDICLASTPISLADGSRLIGLVVGALREVATEHERTGADDQSTASAVIRLSGWIRRTLRPRFADVVDLAQRTRQSAPADLRRRS
jgi:hypothetical protein